ncbi:DUF1616 domain-containing protein [Candidatus Woesearchaeota archaeon]|nr:DUF1616 domain-containing protein [Candidatus Woesearchaeota archaeon]
MKEGTLYNILIGITIVAIIGLLILIFTTPSEESFTELYFEDHANLPSTILIGKTHNFSFSIHNLEQETTSYEYSVYIVEEDGVTLLVDSSSIKLKNEETATIKESFTIEDLFTTAKVVVELNTGEEIHFWITEQ